MITFQKLFSLLLLLPFLTLEVNASSGHALRSRSHHQHLVYIKKDASTDLSLEARMAKRAAGRPLAVRAPAAATSCRTKGVSFLAAVSTSTTSTAAATSTKTTTTNSATPTSSPTGSSNSNSGGSSGGQQSNVAYGSFTPNGIKAAISGGDAYDYFKDHIGWWYDWSPNPSGHDGKPIAVPMIWGAGTADGTDATRLAAFQGLNWNPPYIIGFEEPDCAAGSGSAGMSVDQGVTLWNSLVAPKGWGGSLLISPSMCKQAAESGWLGPFQQKISKNWDITNVHINKNSAAGIYQDLDHYWNTYGKPMWITEFACVDDSTGFVPCEDQGEINNFIWTAVKIFEGDSRVAGYAYSNGYGLGNNWPLMNNGQLSQSGQQYLAAISQYH